MKVAVVTQYFPTSRQPWAGHSAYESLRVLAKRCELKVFHPEAVYPSLLAPRTWTGPLDRAWRPAEVDVEYIPYRVVPAISRPLNGRAIAKSLLGAVEQFEPDVLLNYVVYPDGWAAVQIGKRLGIPVVLTSIGSDLNRISDPLCGALTRSALSNAACVITVSADLCETAVRMGSLRENTQAILNGCDTELFYPGDGEGARRKLNLELEAKTVVYIGRSDLRKGLMELLDAFLLVKRYIPAARLFLVGDGPDKNMLMEKVRVAHAASYIQFVPPCDTSQVAMWMTAADTVVLPSYAEGCPNVVVEALCSGRPVVATNVGGIPELMDDTSGRLVPPKNVGILSEALVSVLSQPWDAQAIASRHRRNWSDVANDVFKVLEQAVASYQGPSNVICRTD